MALVIAWHPRDGMAPAQVLFAAAGGKAIYRKPIPDGPAVLHTALPGPPAPICELGLSILHKSWYFAARGGGWAGGFAWGGQVGMCGAQFRLPVPASCTPSSTATPLPTATLTVTHTPTRVPCPDVVNDARHCTPPRRRVVVLGQWRWVEVTRATFRLSWLSVPGAGWCYVTWIACRSFTERWWWVQPRWQSTFYGDPHFVDVHGTAFDCFTTGWQVPCPPHRTNHLPRAPDSSEPPTSQALKPSAALLCTLNSKVTKPHVSKPDAVRTRTQGAPAGLQRECLPCAPEGKSNKLRC